MGRFFGFIGAIVLIIIGIIFVFDLDSKIFNKESMIEKDPELKATELINIGGITLGVKNDIDSINVSIGGVDGMVYSIETEYGNCLQIKFIPIKEEISPEKFNKFKNYIEDRYEIIFVNDTFSSISIKNGKVRRELTLGGLKAVKEPIDFRIEYENKLNPFIFSIKDVRLESEIIILPINKTTDTSLIAPSKRDSSKISLKGITLGEKNGKTNIQTTVGGVYGSISGHTLKDGTVYSIDFIPTNKNGQWQGITEEQLEKLKIGLEKRYEIHLIHKSDNNTKKTFDADYILIGNKPSYIGDVFFLIRSSHSKSDTKKVLIRLDIIADELRDQHDEEIQDVINSDF